MNITWNSYREPALYGAAAFVGVTLIALTVRHFLAGRSQETQATRPSLLGRVKWIVKIPLYCIEKVARAVGWFFEKIWEHRMKIYDSLCVAYYLNTKDFYGFVVAWLAGVILNSTFQTTTTKKKSVFTITNMNKEIEIKPDKYPRVFGRSAELNQLFTVLQIPVPQAINNVILVGNPGVGKTALVCELARTIVQEPDQEKGLKGFTVYEIEFNSLMAGTKYRGSLEEKVQLLIQFMRNHKNDGIFFMDEFHQINMGDGSNHDHGIPDMFKKVLTEGIRFIGATTPEEYQVLETDSAFTSRFVKINIAEPSVDKTVQIVEEIKNDRWAQYGGSISKELVKTLVNTLKEKAGHFPRKVISAIDLALSTALRGRGENTDDPIQMTQEDIDKALELIGGQEGSSVSMSMYS